MAAGPDEREHRVSAPAPALDAVGKAVVSSGVDDHARFSQHRDPPEHGRLGAGGAG